MFSVLTVLHLDVVVIAVFPDAQLFHQTKPSKKRQRLDLFEEIVFSGNSEGANHGHLAKRVAVLLHFLLFFVQEVKE